MLRINRMGRVAARGRAFNWQKLVNPWASKEFVQDLAANEKRFQDELESARGVKKTQQIDWAYWEKTIKAPGVVAELKKEYETQQFAEITYDDLKPTIEHNKKVIADQKAKMPFLESELKAADAKIKELQNIKAQMQRGEFKLQDLYKFIPGLEDQLREQMTLDRPSLTENDRRVNESLNAKEITASLQKGSLPEIFLHEEHKKIGDLDLQEELELRKKGEWSIERLGKTKEERDAIHAKVLKSTQA
jgi:hypothetical protein